MKPNLVEIDGVKHPLMHWAKIAGINTASIYARVKRGMGIRESIFAPKKNTWQSSDEHDTETDALCESCEPDRRVMVYGMVCCGMSNEGIVEATGYDAAEVARFRAECPAWWATEMRRQKEFGAA